MGRCSPGGKNPRSFTWQEMKTSVAYLDLYTKRLQLLKINKSERGNKQKMDDGAGQFLNIPGEKGRTLRQQNLQLIPGNGSSCSACLCPPCFATALNCRMYCRWHSAQRPLSPIAERKK